CAATVCPTWCCRTRWNASLPRRAVTRPPCTRSGRPRWKQAARTTSASSWPVVPEPDIEHESAPANPGGLPGHSWFSRPWGGARWSGRSRRLLLGAGGSARVGGLAHAQSHEHERPDGDHGDDGDDRDGHRRHTTFIGGLVGRGVARLCGLVGLFHFFLGRLLGLVRSRGLDGLVRHREGDALLDRVPVGGDDPVVDRVFPGLVQGGQVDEYVRSVEGGITVL